MRHCWQYCLGMYTSSLPRYMHVNFAWSFIVNVHVACTALSCWLV